MALDLVMISKAYEAKVNNWHCINIKNFCASKNTIKKGEKATHWLGEKFINHVCDKALSTGYKKNSQNLIIRKHIAPLKRTKSLNRQVTKLNVYMLNKKTKTRSMPLYLGICN